jgi:hypothetical protein
MSTIYEDQITYYRPEYTSIIEGIFRDYNIFVVEESRNKYNDVFIKNDQTKCLGLKFGENFIKIVTLARCKNNPGNGTELMQLVEEVAKLIPNVLYLKLEDAANITLSNGSKINLAFLKILTKGESWYNSLGYYSDTYEEEKRNNNNVIQTQYSVLIENLISNWVDGFKSKNTKENIEAEIIKLEETNNRMFHSCIKMYKSKLNNYDSFIDTEVQKIIANGVEIINMGNQKLPPEYQIIIEPTAQYEFKLSMNQPKTVQEYISYLATDENVHDLLVKVVNFISASSLKYSVFLKKDLTHIINQPLKSKSKSESKSKSKTKSKSKSKTKSKTKSKSKSY